MIRLLGVHDAADYRSIRLAALMRAPEAFGSTYADEADRPLSDFEARVCAPWVFGAYAGTAIIGMVGFKQEEGPKVRHKGFLWGLYVDPQWRGQGAGEALVEAVLDQASGSVEQVTLTVVTNNAVAIALYERLGFRSFGTEPRALKTEAGYDDEMLMIRFLDRPPSGQSLPGRAGRRRVETGDRPQCRSVTGPAATAPARRVPQHRRR